MGYVQAQDIQYVKAENGLAIRENPNRGAARLGVLDYGTVLEIIEHTNPDNAKQYVRPTK